MTRVVEAAASEFGDAVRWEKVITRQLKGAMRYRELSKILGRPAPVPSLFVDGTLQFEVTPGVEELKARISAVRRSE